MRRSLRIAFCVAAAALALAPVLAPASLREAHGQEVEHRVKGKEPYVVSGFRSARFGMSEAEVKSAITRDFGLPAAQIRRVQNNVDGTTALLARVEKLDPAPGPAAVSYIFGAESKRLMHVNVVWLANEVDAYELRPKFVAAAARLSKYFMNFTWRDNVVISGTKVGPSSLVTFLGKDESGAAAEVRLDGVRLVDDTSGKPLNPEIALGPVRLRVSYAQNPNDPDVKRVNKGNF